MVLLQPNVKILINTGSVTLVLYFLLCIQCCSLTPVSVTPVFSLQLTDGGQTCAVRLRRRRGPVWSQQSRVHGESAAEQRGVPARRLPGGRPLVHQRPASRPAELHPVQQPFGGASQTGTAPGGAR